MLKRKNMPVSFIQDFYPKTKVFRDATTSEKLVICSNASLLKNPENNRTEPMPTHGLRPFRRVGDIYGNYIVTTDTKLVPCSNDELLQAKRMNPVTGNFWLRKEEPMPVPSNMSKEYRKLLNLNALPEGYALNKGPKKIELAFLSKLRNDNAKMIVLEFMKNSVGGQLYKPLLVNFTRQKNEASIDASARAKTYYNDAINELTKYFERGITSGPIVDAIVDNFTNVLRKLYKDIAKWDEHVDPTDMAKSIRQLQEYSFDISNHNQRDREDPSGIATPQQTNEILTQILQTLQGSHEERKQVEANANMATQSKGGQGNVAVKTTGDTLPPSAPPANDPADSTAIDESEYYEEYGNDPELEGKYETGSDPENVFARAPPTKIVESSLSSDSSARSPEQIAELSDQILANINVDEIETRDQLKAILVDDIVNGTDDLGNIKRIFQDRIIETNKTVQAYKQDGSQPPPEVTALFNSDGTVLRKIDEVTGQREHLKELINTHQEQIKALSERAPTLEQGIKLPPFSEGDDPAGSYVTDFRKLQKEEKRPEESSEKYELEPVKIFEISKSEWERRGFDTSGYKLIGKIPSLIPFTVTQRIEDNFEDSKNLEKAIQDTFKIYIKSELVKDNEYYDFIDDLILMKGRELKARQKEYQADPNDDVKIGIDYDKQSIKILSHMKTKKIPFFELRPDIAEELLPTASELESTKYPTVTKKEQRKQLQLTGPLSETQKELELKTQPVASQPPTVSQSLAPTKKGTKKGKKKADVEDPLLAQIPHVNLAPMGKDKTNIEQAETILHNSNDAELSNLKIMLQSRTVSDLDELLSVFKNTLFERYAVVKNGWSQVYYDRATKAIEDMIKSKTKTKTLTASSSSSSGKDLSASLARSLGASASSSSKASPKASPKAPPEIPLSQQDVKTKEELDSVWNAVKGYMDELVIPELEKRKIKNIVSEGSPEGKSSRKKIENMSIKDIGYWKQQLYNKGESDTLDEMIQYLNEYNSKVATSYKLSGVQGKVDINKMGKNAIKVATAVKSVRSKAIPQGQYGFGRKKKTSKVLADDAYKKSTKKLMALEALPSGYELKRGPTKLSSADLNAIISRILSS